MNNMMVEHDDGWNLYRIGMSYVKTSYSTRVKPNGGDNDWG